MKKNLFILFAATLLISTGCKKDFLDKYPIDDMTDETYWTSEENVRLYAWGFYEDYFTGYGSGYVWGEFFTGQSLNDDFAPSVPAQFTQNTPTTAGVTHPWNLIFKYIRRANLMIDRVQDVGMDDEALKHWTGVARFFRGLGYARLVQHFGDVPWFNRVPETDEPDYLYKSRDGRTLVMDSVLADFEYATENILTSDGDDGLTVNRYVALAFMSRVFLFEGTWLKYHDIDQTRANIYLEAAKEAANEIIESASYSLSGSYRELFNSLSLSGNPEIILYRSYEEGVLTHCLNSYNDYEPQTGASKNLIDTYLCTDGLPISLSTNYLGDDGIANVMANRDPRMYETFVQELRLNGEISNYSTTGYSCHKFLNEDISGETIGTYAYNPTDAPIIRYGEVLINYAEACAELGTITQNDLNKSINVLRSRNGLNVAPLEIQGGQPAIGGVAYDDPNRDPDVSSLIWEIRRERRTELVFEGFRLKDLKRWKKLEYVDTRTNETINRGAYIRLADHPEISTDVKIEDDATEGYMVPAWTDATQRSFDNERVYLDPIPIDQLQLYRDNGYTLEQNPGWDGL